MRRAPPAPDEPRRRCAASSTSDDATDDVLTATARSPSRAVLAVRACVAGGRGSFAALRCPYEAWSSASRPPPRAACARFCAAMPSEAQRSTEVALRRLLHASEAQRSDADWCASPQARHAVDTALQYANDLAAAGCVHECCACPRSHLTLRLTRLMRPAVQRACRRAGGVSRAHRGAVRCAAADASPRVPARARKQSRHRRATPPPASALRRRRRGPGRGVAAPARGAAVDGHGGHAAAPRGAAGGPD